MRRSTRVVAAGFALALATMQLVVPTGSAAVESDPHQTPSAMTKRGTGRFADLEVKVGKTEHLSNEAVKVSWRWTDEDPGAHATTSSTEWRTNHLAIFQCWGDADTGPTREQCQYGGQFSNKSDVELPSPFTPNSYGKFGLSRVVSPVDYLGRPVPQSTDPLETRSPDGYGVVGGVAGIVPLRSAPTTEHPQGQLITLQSSGDSIASTWAQFDKYQTNEVPLARTTGVGTGQVFFEAQTEYESQFLGCGARVDPDQDGTVDGRGCWLVVVPREQVDVDGTDVVTRPMSEAFLWSSPLSLSNWANRIVFPLAFDPVRKPCALGGVERPVVGHESLGLAMSSWQGPLCAAGQGFFFAPTTDDIARGTAASELPQLSVVTDPLPEAAIEADRGAAVYAPVAASGISISLFIEREYNSLSGAERLRYNGTRVEQLKLTPRLVAKLLTESYRYSIYQRDGGPEHLQKAPANLLADPEFQELNDSPNVLEDVTHLRNQPYSLAKLFVPPNQEDGIRLLWEWILADQDARAFLDGRPDEWGMKVNRDYAGLSKFEAGGQPRSDIQKLSKDCFTAAFAGVDKEVCALDANPYVASLEQGAALTARGQQLGFESYELGDGGVIKPGKPSPQLVGQRALLTLTDTPAAARRGLVSASLRNASGSFVPPTTTSLGAAVDQAVRTSVAGVSRIDPDRVTGGGYPLTRFSYAVTNPALLEPPAREDYAAFITTVTTAGQQQGPNPGNLPFGYAPLPTAYREQAASAATAIRTAKAPEPESPEEPGGTLPPGGTDDGGSGGLPLGGDDQLPLDPPAVTGDDAVAAPAAPGAVVPQVPVAGADSVPGVGANPVTQALTRGAAAAAPWLLPILGVLCLVAAASGQVMVRLGAKK